MGAEEEAEEEQDAPITNAEERRARKHKQERPQPTDQQCQSIDGRMKR